MHFCVCWPILAHPDLFCILACGLSFHDAVSWRFQVHADASCGNGLSDMSAGVMKSITCRPFVFAFLFPPSVAVLMLLPSFALRRLMLQLKCYVCSHQFSSYMSTSTSRCHVTFDFPVTAVPASPIALLPCSCHFGFFFYCYSFEGDTPYQLAMSDYL